MATRLDADRWGELDILEVAPVDLPASGVPSSALWGCGRCGDDHRLADGSVVKVRSHLGVADQIVCARCAAVARRRCVGVRSSRVLLVDDDNEHRDVLRRTLEDAGVAEVVGYVRPGRQALVETERLRPDTVVLDLAEPRVVGLELLSELPDKVRVIVISGRPRTRQRCRQRRPGTTVLADDRAGRKRLLTLLDEAH